MPCRKRSPRPEPREAAAGSACGARGAVNQFANNVGVARVPACFDTHVHQDLVVCHLPAFRCPPRHRAHSVQGQQFNGFIAVPGGIIVQFKDVRPALARPGPHVGIQWCAGSEPGQFPAGGAVEHLAKVAQLDTRHVLDQAKQVRARGSHGTADVVIADPVKFREQVCTSDAQVPEEFSFFTHAAHSAPSRHGAPSIALRLRQSHDALKHLEMGLKKRSGVSKRCLAVLAKNLKADRAKEGCPGQDAGSQNVVGNGQAHRLADR